MTRRFVLTGAPGCGKTTVIRELAVRGHAVVAEAATDVITMQQSAGVAEPWTQRDFVDRVVALQLRRHRLAVATDVQFLDRSPLCSVALARFLGHPLAAATRAAIEAFVADPTVARTAFLLAPVGPIERTAARRISDADAVVFAGVHVEVYREYGFKIVDVPASEPHVRADVVEALTVPARHPHVDRADGRWPPP